MRRLVLLGLLFSLPASPQEITKRVGQLAIRVDPTWAFPGGVLVVHLNALLGTTYALLNGLRISVFPAPHGARALVPISALAVPGPATLGIELVTRRGRERIPVEVQIAPRSFPSASVVIPELKRGFLARVETQRESRELLELLRTETHLAQWTGPFAAPVPETGAANFGARETYVGGSGVETRFDSIWGDYHRGLDYEVPSGTPVQAPGGGTVLLAAPLILTGETLVIDHGQGIVSVFYHLSRIDVREGERVEGGAPIALSGASGIAAAPHLHWGVFLHGVAVDPELLQKILS
jgi:murein DD-endopeptidase MepM/ murein hydrolase activator NlpD